MLGLVNFFFMMVFFFAFGRLVVELLFGHRDLFLIKFSLALMVLSAGVVYLMMRLQDWEIEHQTSTLPDLIVVSLFLGGAVVCGLLGYLWLKRMK